VHGMGHKIELRSNAYFFCMQLVSKTFKIYACVSYSISGVLKLWVATRRWVAEALQVGRGVTPKK